MGTKRERKDSSLDLAELRDHPGLRRVYREPAISFWGWIVVAVLTVFLAVGIRTFVFQSFKIPSESMLPTLQIGDHILVNKFIYGLTAGPMDERLLQKRPPRTGDVVVFHPSQAILEDPNDVPAEYYIKRVIGTPGDEIEVRGSMAFVNGKNVDVGRELVLPIAGVGTDTSLNEFGPLRLRADEYFLMGDNRINSRDSRYFGPIPGSLIQGQAFLIYWSWSSTVGDWEVNWQRFGKSIR